MVPCQYKDREEVDRWYAENRYKEKDEDFRKLLELGPQERRWLGWAGKKVRVLSAYEGLEAPLCPTKWVYRFVSTDCSDTILHSPEINFCDDADVLDRIPSWMRNSDLLDGLRGELQDPGPLMYYI